MNSRSLTDLSTIEIRFSIGRHFFGDSGGHRSAGLDFLLAGRTAECRTAGEWQIVFSVIWGLVGRGLAQSCAD